MAGAVSRVRDWWSHTLFPGDATATHAPDPCRKVVRLCAVLLVLAAALLSFSRLDCPLQEPEETLYAEVPRQMFAADRVLVPVRHGQAYYDKPPLLYWLVMAVYRCLGYGRRLVPVLIATWAYSNYGFALAVPTERTEAIVAGMVAALGCGQPIMRNARFRGAFPALRQAGRRFQ